MTVKLTSSRRGGVQDLFHRRSSGGGSVSSRRSRSSITSSKRSSNKSNKRGRQSSNSRRSRSRSRSRTRSSSKQRQRRHCDENNNNTNNLIVNKSFEQKLTQDVESMSAQHKQRSHPSSSKSNTKQHRRRYTADSTTTKSTKSSSTAPTYCHDGIDLLFSDVISPLSGAICTFLTTCLCDDNLIDCAGDQDDRHLHRVSSPRDNRQMVNSRIPQRSKRDEKIKGSGNRRRVSPTVNGVVLKQEEYNTLQPIDGASAVVVEEEEVIMYY